jgi:hypothetical protein
MTSWSTTATRALTSGGVASLVSTAALAVLGEKQAGSPLGPINAISHWLRGERAAHTERLDARHTVTGFLTHHAASLFWALVFERVFGDRARRSPGAALAGGLATAALACAVDYTLTPRRFTPGYEKRLPPSALAVVYLAFGLGLAATRLRRA